MSIKVIVIVFLGLIAIALAKSIDYNRIRLDVISTHPPPFLGIDESWIEPRPFPPIRTIRSPDGGSVKVNVNHNDKTGTSGSVNAKQNIWSSYDGKTKVDANAGAFKNFDHGTSNKHAGISLNHEW